MMKIKYPLLLFLLSVSIPSHAQVKHLLWQKQSNLINSRSLLGKWVSADDSLSTLVFKSNVLFQTYKGFGTDIFNYVLSTSCSLKDSSYRVNQQNAYLLYYSKDSLVQDCFLIEGLTHNILSLLANINGHLYIYRRSPREKK